MSSTVSIQQDYPEVGDLVISTVTRVVDYGAYVKLDEYGGKEGLIHISEISSTWVKNIRDRVREGQKLVLKVLRINPQRVQVDLSLRRVTGRERSNKLLEWKKAKKVESIIKSAAERLKVDEELQGKIRKILIESSEVPLDVFEEALEDGDEIFLKLGIPQEWASALIETAKSKIRVEKAKVKATVELSCNRGDGIEMIKSALKNAKKTKKGRGSSVKIYALGSPKYAIEVTAGTYPDAERLLNQAVEEALSSIKELGGEGRRAA